jgi:protein arginine kinase activator
MAESAKCKVCGKEATIHLTQILQNKIQKMDLCEECAQKGGVTSPEGLPLGEFLAPLGWAEEPAAAPRKIVCPQCGFSSRDFQRTGRLGCAGCYGQFRPMLEPLLGQMHKGTRHRGKAPRQAQARVSLQRRISDLEKNLHEAVKKELFEDAAHYRDQLNSLRSQTAGQPEAQA